MSFNELVNRKLNLFIFLLVALAVYTANAKISDLKKNTLLFFLSFYPTSLKKVFLKNNLIK